MHFLRRRSRGYRANTCARVLLVFVFDTNNTIFFPFKLIRIQSTYLRSQINAARCFFLFSSFITFTLLARFFTLSLTLLSIMDILSGQSERGANYKLYRLSASQLKSFFIRSKTNITRANDYDKVSRMKKLSPQRATRTFDLYRKNIQLVLRGASVRSSRRS